MQRRRLQAVERADDLHVQVVREAQRVAAVAAAVHDDRRRVVRARRVAGAGHAVAERLQLRGFGGGGARAAVAVQDEDLRLVARQLRRRGDACFDLRATTAASSAPCERGGLGVALHRVRERLREQEHARRRRAARARPRRRGWRRASRSARGGSARRVQGVARPQRHSFRYGAACFLHPGPRSARGRRRARPRARQPSSRSISATSSTERRTSPSRAASRAAARASLPATRAARGVQLRDASSRRPVPTLYGPPLVADRREQRGDDVADVDEVAAAARRRRRSPSPRRAPSARGRSRRRRLRGPSPGAGRRRSRSGATTCDVPWMRFQPGEVLLAALLRDPVGRERQERRLLGRPARGTRRSPRRRTRRRSPARRRPAASSTLTVPTTFTAAS